MKQKIEKFFLEILPKPEYVIQEQDRVVKNRNNSQGQIYLPVSFWKLLQTKPVKRMSKILQLGTKIYLYKDVIHTRLQHSMGAYERTLDMLVTLYQNKQIKQLIRDNHYEKYVIAELIRILLHDIGHGPFSHTLETVCNLPKGFHEEIGYRLITENEELKTALENIYPGLPMLVKEVEEKNFLGLNCFFEGECDLDRSDFLIRDMLYLYGDNKQINKTVQELFSNFEIKKIDANGKKKLVPVFEANQIQNIDSFLKIRFHNYKDIYYHNNTTAYDYILKIFAQNLIRSDEPSKLKDFLLHNKDKKSEEVDLKEYIEFNDIEFLKGIIEIVKQTKNPLLKQLALLALPSAEVLERINKTEETDVVLEQYITELKDKESKLGSTIKDKDYQQECVLLQSEKVEEVEEIKNTLKEYLAIEGELEDFGIISWNKKISFYKGKQGEEIYIKGEDGKIYEYSEHPDRKEEIIQTELAGLCLLIPLLKDKGYTEEQIIQSRSIIENFNKKIIEGESLAI